MGNYLLRRILYMIPILIGVNVITFFLFFMVNTPDDMARIHLGQKYVTQDAMNTWKEKHGYDKPLFYNNEEKGIINQLTQTIFYQKSIKLFAFDFGYSDGGRDIRFDVYQRMFPSLYIAVPSLILGLLLHITFALIIVFFRGTYLDVSGVFVCVILMSISGMFYIIAGQYLMAKLLKLVPISGFSYISPVKFIILPIVISAIAGLGAQSRWYRTLFLEEINKDYVRTARAKGLSESMVLLKHVLGNAMIPILTGVVSLLPLLFLGSLITESFFAIPGLGSYTIDAIQQQDFAIVRSMVFLGSFLFIIGLILTDISYTLVDPRIKFE